MFKLEEQEQIAEQHRRRAHVAEADLAKTKDDLEYAHQEAECDKTHFLRVQAARDHQLGIAHRLVADAAPREEVLQLKAKMKEKESEIQKLRNELKAQSACLTPRPNLFRASEHVELKLNDIPRRSRDVVDDVCDKLDFTTQRLERLEERLDRLAT
eukprot:Tamp_06054.p1 GENE.Tamp_06054~~Tamp_06054.p1  ORF type:complete len:156 (+),score=33.58 Tamp_06054:1065-1532(+)